MNPIVPALVVLALAGCLAAPPEPVVEAAAVGPAPAGLLATPRTLAVPAGDSYAFLWLNATPEDWTEQEDGHWLTLGFEMPEDVEMDGFAIGWGDVEGDTLAFHGSHHGSGSGAGSSGSRDEKPEARSSLVWVMVANASAPFEMRFGAMDGIGDFELEGAPVPADVIDQGTGGHLAAYMEFVTPFDAVFASEPWTFGFDVEDARVAPAGGVVGAAGALDLAFEHDVEGPGLHAFSAVATTYQGQRAGTWSASHATDEDLIEEGGVMVDPFLPWLFVDSLPQDLVSGHVRYDIAAETMPLTLVFAQTAPFDPAALGLTIETDARLYGPPPILVLESGCLDPAAPAAPTMAACVLRAE